MNRQTIVAMAALAMASGTACQTAPPTRDTTADLTAEQDPIEADDSLADDSVTPEQAPETAAMQSPHADETATPPRRRLPAEEIRARTVAWISDLVDTSPARITIEEGPLSWRLEHSERSHTGAFVVADVKAARSCGVPQSLRVRIPYHSELPHLQPSAERPLLLFGRYGEGEGVLTARWVAPYDGEALSVHRQRVPLTTETLFSDCSEVSR